MQKDYVLDANILLRDPDSMFGFADNRVHITYATVMELSSKKPVKGDHGHNAKEALDNIYKLLAQSTDPHSIPINGGTGALCLHPPGMTARAAKTASYDETLIHEIRELAILEETDGMVLVTNKPALHVIAFLNGLKAESYRNEQTFYDKSYKGWQDITVPSDVIDLLYSQHSVEADIVKELASDYNDTSKMFQYENEYYRLSDGRKESVAIFQSGILKHIDRYKNVFGVKPRNAKQAMLFHALAAPASDIPLVIIRGPAGTGKTFCALAAGLEANETGDYRNLMISRNHVLTEEDFGALPGDLGEKMKPLLGPFYDNLEDLLTKKEGSWQSAKQKMLELFENGEVEECALSYIRGRSIANRYFILDEAQNAGPRQMRNIITRAGEDTKIVICGDISQIDADDLDEYTNGLVFAAESMKGSPTCAQIVFDKEDCVRSRLASEALLRMK